MDGGGWYPKISQNICLLNIYRYQKKNWHPRLSGSQNYILAGPIEESSGGGTSKLCQNICQLNIYCY